MAVLLRFIADYSLWIYLACGIAILLYLRMALMARREKAAALFALEREMATARQHRAIGMVFFLLAVMGGLFLFNLYLVPAINIPTQEETATPTPLLWPTPSRTPLTPTPTRSPTPTRTRRIIILLPTETPTPTPMTPPPCPNPDARLTFPPMNAVLRGAVEIVGTANIRDFQYYKLEFGPGDSPTSWSFILSGDKKVVNGPLGVWDTSALAPGVYTLRLVVVDITGNYPEPCTVRVIIER